MGTIIIILGIIIFILFLLFSKKIDNLKNENDELKRKINNNQPTTNKTYETGNTEINQNNNFSNYNGNDEIKRNKNQSDVNRVYENKKNENKPDNNYHENNLPIDFDESVFRVVFDLMENTNNSVFITGKAGTGKSTLIDYFRIKTQKKAVYLAPTGVAALNIKGKTIHSLFQFPHSVITSDEINKTPYKEKTLELFKNVNVILIDEISMVRADVIQGIDYVLKIYREPTKPFGGAQMIFIGDVYQLPPVVEKKDIKLTRNGKMIYVGHLIDYFNNKYGGPFFFNSDAFRETDFEYYELTTVFRQKDSDFINLLNAIREKRFGAETLQKINRNNTGMTDNHDDKAITLCSTKADADRKNKMMMEKLQSAAYIFEAELTGSFSEKNSKDYPAEKQLILKKGAKIMMLVNDKEGKWVNGTIGVIDKLSNDGIAVRINDVPHDVNQNVWEEIDYEYDKEEDKLIKKIIGTYRQYPVMLAWAITIHKSQGKTFEKVIIDLGNRAFAHGQTYVALSRCKTLEGITLKRPVENKDIIVDDVVINFIRNINNKIID